MEWNMDIVKAEFVVSNATVEKCPKPDRHEYAFIGRSNVGKSSGYGYARTSETARRQFEKMIRDYILKRENLVCLFVLIDSRLEPQKIDLEFMEWLGENGVPFVMIFTKADKLSATQRLKCIDDYHKVMLETWETTPMAFMTSSEKRLGREEVLDYIDELNRTVKL